MSSNLFEKILKVVQICLGLLEMALKAFKGIDKDDEGDTTA